MLYFLPLGPEEEDLADGAVETPWVTYGLLAGNVLLWLVIIATATSELYVKRVFDWGYRPELPLGVGLLTHQFLHADFFHLLGNGIFLMAFGVALERKLGHATMIFVYLSAGICGAWLHGSLASEMHIPLRDGRVLSVYPPLIGASGAIAGLIGGLLSRAPSLRIRILMGVRHVYRVVPVSAWMVGVVYIAKELLWTAVDAGGGVAYAAHVGGAVGGALSAFALQFLRAPSLPSLPAMPVRPPARVGGGPAAAEPAVQPIPVSSSPARPPEARATAPSPAPPAPPPETPSGSFGASEDISTEGPSVPDDDTVEEAEEIGEVPASQDYEQVSGVWAPSIRTADLQDRLRRARKMEKDPERARVAFSFYKKLLGDDEVPPGYRAYAGARAARMLARAGRYEKAERLAGKLLANPLPEGIRRHVAKTQEVAGRRRAGGSR